MTKIAIMVENSRAYGRAMIEGIAAYAQKNRQWLLRPLATDEATVASLREFDGVIARIADEQLAERLVRSKVPAVDVFCQRPHAGIAGVDSDHRRIGTLAREFFVRRGFVNFGYCGLPGSAFSDLREKAFADGETMVYSPSRRQPARESQFYDERLDRIPDRRQLAKWLHSLPRPIAVFCCNDLRAIQLQHIAVECGLRIPQDLAILGVDDDTTACSFAEIPISSINPNSFEVGYTAARILGAMIAKGPIRKLHRTHYIKPGEIIERASTEFMPIDPPWLGNVLMHIEKNMSRPVPASEVFALAGRSSTFVENIFKSKLGMPVQAYVNTVKLREARRLLSDPDLRISEIADLCGFASPQYFCRAFTTAYGSSPKTCRRNEGTLANVSDAPRAGSTHPKDKRGRPSAVRKKPRTQGTLVAHLT